MSRYSAAELAVIESFMAGTAEVMAAYREELQAASHPASEGGGNPGA